MGGCEEGVWGDCDFGIDIFGGVGVHFDKSETRK